MKLDDTDKQLLSDIRENPGKALRFYADRIWLDQGSMSRSGAVFRLMKLKSFGLVDIAEVHCRLNSVRLTEQGRAVLTTGVQE